MKQVYVIDACALIDAAKNYNMSKNTFSSIWDKLNEMIETGELISSTEIFDELKDDDLKKWANLYKKAFLPLSPAIQNKAKEVLKDYPNLIKIRSTSNSNGDPFLIATALVNNGCIVTNEKPGDEKQKDYHIPNVCVGMNIPYMNLRTFLDTILD